MSIPSIRDLGRIAEDSFYVVVGIGVLTIDRVRGRRQDLVGRLDTRIRRDEPEAASPRGTADDGHR